MNECEIGSGIGFEPTTSRPNIAAIHTFHTSGGLPGKREGNQKEVFPIHWRVKIVNPGEPASATIEVSSEKAGVKRQNVDLF